ncbi:hypothetical protein GGR28_002762 [Lewinella aquimaris]|uniref:Uncharacterized protein n=1 Tax=Neolewinella aquimaris TaxID=1835722 RepID=A0A840E8T9_9BACT|nr:hypothetical protein [Neolewinella aquimaris]MBB4080132.1 hypothetical protein [Neolewinella aquimaris]
MSPRMMAQGDMDGAMERPAPVLLREGAQLSFQFVSGDTEPDADMVQDGNSMVYFLEGERGRHEDMNLKLTVSPDTNTMSLDDDTSDSELDADYVVFETGKEVKEDWLRPGTIFGFHHIALKPDADKAEFEKFIRNVWSPTQSDALPDSKIIFLKSIRGDRAGEYSFVWIIDSEETRDYYFPESGVPSKMYTEFEKGWSWIAADDQMGKFVSPDTEEFTDYVVR